MTPFLEATKRTFSEQDTADKLVLPYLHRHLNYPAPDSLDFQAQHTLPTDGERQGRYDGLYLHGGFPYAILEAKKYGHDLKGDDSKQARKYALSDLFDEPVPFIIVSNGREYNFFKKSPEIDQEDGKISYLPIPEAHWGSITREQPGKIKLLLTAEQLLKKLKNIKEMVYGDIRNMFFDYQLNKFNIDNNPIFKHYLSHIINERKIYIGTASDEQKQIEFAIQTIALHFTIKILFIKIVEDLSSGLDTPRIIHNLFPREEYNLMGGVFGYKVLNYLKKGDRNNLIKLYLKSKSFYSQLGQDIAKVTYEDIFRYGFNVHMMQYGKILKAANYDMFFPSDVTLRYIREELIKIDIRNALIYGTPETKNNVIGDIYGKLIDIELRDSIGAVYTPDDTVDFMVGIAHRFLGRF